MSVETDPVPPVPIHTPPREVDDRVGEDRNKTLFTQTWARWFTSLRDKINVINESIANLAGLPTGGVGILVKNGAAWLTRSIAGTAGNISVTNGNGVGGNPTINLITTGVTAGSYTNANITVDAFGRLTNAANGSGGGGGGGSGAMSLVAEATVSGSAVTSIVFSGLNLATDGSYHILLSLKNATGGTIVANMYYNGDSTNANYRSQSIYTNAATIASNQTNDGRIAEISASARTFAVCDIALDVDNFPRAIGNSARDTGTGLAFQPCTHVWATAANVTSITFTSSVASGFAVGTNIKVYKITPISNGNVFSGWNVTNLPANVTASNSNFTLTRSGGTNNSRPVYHTVARNTGKYAVRFLITGTTTTAQGPAGGMLAGAVSGYVGNTVNSSAFWPNATGTVDDYTYTGGAGFNRGNLAAFTSPVEIMLEMDFGTGRVWYGVNGTWIGGGNPAAGTGQTYTLTVGPTLFYTIAADMFYTGVVQLLKPSEFITPASTGFTAGWPD